MQDIIKITNRESIISVLQNIYKTLEDTEKETIILNILKEEGIIGYIRCSYSIDVQYKIEFEEDYDSFNIFINLKSFLHCISLQETKSVQFHILKESIKLPVPLGELEINLQEKIESFRYLSAQTESRFKLNSEEFNHGIDFCKYYQSKEFIKDGKDRQCLNYFIYIKNSEFIIICSNRHFLGRYKIKINQFNNNIRFNCIIRRQLIDFVSKNINEEKEINLIFTESSIIIQVNDLIAVTELDETLIDYEQLLPKPNNIRTVFNLLSDKLSTLKRLFRHISFIKWGLKIKITNNDNPQIINFKINQEQNPNQLKSSFQIKSEEYLKFFTHKYMCLYFAIGLKSLNADKDCKLIITKSEGCLILFQKLNQNSTKTVLLMPITEKEASIN